MHIPSKAMTEKIVAKHRKKKIRVSKKATAEMYLFYLCFMKRMAKACDDRAQRQNKQVIGRDITRDCAPRVLASLSVMERIARRPAPDRDSSGHQSETNSNFLESDDEPFSDED